MKPTIKPEWTDQADDSQSLYERVTETGTMRPEDILNIVRMLCDQLNSRDSAVSARVRRLLRPRSIRIQPSGHLCFDDQAIEPVIRDPYRPPEQIGSDADAGSGDIYALGMMMLFMATGQEKKVDLDTFVADPKLRSAIERCTAFDPQQRFRSIGELSDFIRRRDGRTRKRLAVLLILIGLGAASAAVVYFYHRGSSRGAADGRTAGYLAGYAAGYEKGFADVPGIGLAETPFHPDMGNLPGNVAAENGAFAVRSERDIFFIHEGSLYQMDPYTGSIKMLAAAARARDLNFYDGWLYYGTDSGIRRLDPVTGRDEAFCSQKSGTLYIQDGGFYLLDTADTGYLYEIHPVSGAVKQLNDRTAYGCLNIADGRLYFSDPGRADHLYSTRPDGSDSKLLNSNRLEWFCVYDGRIYGYAAADPTDDQTAAGDSASSLMIMNAAGGLVRKYGNTPAAYINVTEGGIFYVAGGRRTLEWMSFDGKTRYTIAATPTGPFNIAGRWIFYRNLADGGSLWRIRIDGSDAAKVSPP